MNLFLFKLKNKNNKMDSAFYITIYNFSSAIDIFFLMTCLMATLFHTTTFFIFFTFLFFVLNIHTRTIQCQTYAFIYFTVVTATATIYLPLPLLNYSKTKINICSFTLLSHGTFQPVLFVWKMHIWIYACMCLCIIFMNWDGIGHLGNI